MGSAGDLADEQSGLSPMGAAAAFGADRYRV
jgi:hypothetical protein